MSKRFTDTEIWSKLWFQELTPIEKAFWFYLKDNCNNIGVWDVNYRLAEFQLGGKLNWEALPEKFNSNIVLLNERKWWLVDFCTFQYKELSENSTSKPIESYIKQLKKYKLWEKYKEKSKGYVKGIDTLQEKDKEKDKEKEKEKEKEKDKEKAINILGYYKTLTGKTRITKLPPELTARLKDGATVEDCKKIILYKYKKWWSDEKTRTWVNLTTLFRPSHFEEYLSQAEDELDNILHKDYEEYCRELRSTYTGDRTKFVAPTLEEFKHEHEAV